MCPKHIASLRDLGRLVCLEDCFDGIIQSFKIVVRIVPKRGLSCLELVLNCLFLEQSGLLCLEGKGSVCVCI